MCISYKGVPDETAVYETPRRGRHARNRKTSVMAHVSPKATKVTKADGEKPGECKW